MPSKLIVSAATEGEKNEGVEKDNPPGEAKTEIGSAVSGEETEVARGEKIYHLTVVLAMDEEYELYFDAAVSSSEGFLKLRNRNTGETAPHENYQVTRQGQGFCITFEEDFIRRLNPGKNDFALSWSGGRVMIRITIL